MWVYLNNAFLSIVQHRDDPGALLVRARRHDDLFRFLSGNDAGIGIEIERTPEADYPYRARVPRLTLGHLLADQALRIDYDNFKASLRSPLRAAAYTEAYHATETLDERDSPPDP